MVIRVGDHLSGPVLPAALIHSVGPFIELGQALWTASRAPRGVAVQGLTEVGEDLLHVGVNPELSTPADHRAEIGPLQVPRVGHSDMPFSVETRLVRLLKAVAAVAVLQVISE